MSRVEFHPLINKLRVALKVQQPPLDLLSLSLGGGEGKPRVARRGTSYKRVVPAPPPPTMRAENVSFVHLHPPPNVSTTNDSATTTPPERHRSMCQSDILKSGVVQKTSCAKPPSFTTLGRVSSSSLPSHSLVLCRFRGGSCRLLRPVWGSSKLVSLRLLLGRKRRSSMSPSPRSTGPRAKS